MSERDDPWWGFGACRDADPALFFHPEGERGPDRRRRARQAKNVCSSCPVMSACRDEALLRREPYGTWGGLSEADRERLRRPNREPAFHFLPAKQATADVAAWLADGRTLEELSAESGISLHALGRLANRENRLIHPSTEAAIRSAVQGDLDVAV